jgi:hypothetical protein
VFILIIYIGGFFTHTLYRFLRFVTRRRRRRPLIVCFFFPRVVMMGNQNQNQNQRDDRQVVSKMANASEGHAFVELCIKKPTL